MAKALALAIALTLAAGNAFAQVGFLPSSGGATFSSSFFGPTLPGGITATGGANGHAFNSSGCLIAASAPRFDYNPSTLVLRGMEVENVRTNFLLWNRDLTNAAWTKTNATVALDQTGIDCLATSSSSFAATAANATVCQAITSASATRFLTVWVQRLAGSGAIGLSMDNGSTFPTVTTLQSGQSGWSRIQIPLQTTTNPTVCIRLATSGDSIAVDAVQLETGSDPTSEIFTTTASVTRSVEVVQAASPAWFSYTAGTVVAAWEQRLPIIVVGNKGVVGDGAGILLRESSTAVSANTNDGTNTVANGTRISGVNKASVSYGGSGLKISTNGAPATTGSFVGTMGSGSFFFGSWQATTQCGCWLRSVQFWPVQYDSTVLPQLSAF